MWIDFNKTLCLRNYKYFFENFQKVLHFMLLFIFYFFFFAVLTIYLYLDIYHGINGNMSLDRRGGLVQPLHRYDLNLSSDKSSSISRSDAGTYDVIQAEIQHAKRQELTTLSNGNVSSCSHDTDTESKVKVLKIICLFL